MVEIARVSHAYLEIPANAEIARITQAYFELPVSQELARITHAYFELPIGVPIRPPDVIPYGGPMVYPKRKARRRDSDDDVLLFLL